MPLPPIPGMPGPYGWVMDTPEGNQFTLPDDAAQQMFDMSQAGQPAPEQTPLGAPPQLGVPQLEQPMQAPPQEAQPQPFLPPGVDHRSVSVSGSMTAPSPILHGRQINTRSIEHNNDRMGQELSGAFDEKAAASAARAQVQVEADEALQPYYDQKASLLQQEGEAEMARHQQAQQQLVMEEQRITQQVAAIPQEDPGHYWHNLSGFEQAMGVMTMVLGGIQGASMGTGKNAGVDLALQLVDRDMAAQRNNIDTAKAKVGYAQEAYGRHSQRNYYDKLAMQEQKAYKLETLAAAMEAKAMTYKSKFTQAEFLKTVADIRLERDNVLNDLMTQRTQQVMQATQMNNQLAMDQARLAQQKAEFAYKQAQDKAKAAADAALVKEAGLAVGVSTGYTRKDGKTMYRVNTGDDVSDRRIAEKLQNAGPAAVDLYRALGTLREMSLDHVKTPEEAAAASAEVNRALMAWSNATGQKLSKTTEDDIKRATFALIGGKAGMVDLKTQDYYRGQLSKSMDILVEDMNRMGAASGDDDITWSPPKLEQAPRQPSLGDAQLSDSQGTAGSVERIGQLGYDPSIDPNGKSFKQSIDAEVSNILGRKNHVRNGTAGLLEGSEALMHKALELRDVDPAAGDYVLSQALRLRDEYDKAERDYAKKQADEKVKQDTARDRYKLESSVR